MPSGGVPVTTPLTPTAYVTVADAETYFATILNTNDWDSATAANQQAALYMATRAIDRLQFQGVTSAEYNARILGQDYVPQPLQFPRNGASWIPDDIVMACCEEALSLLGGADVSMEISGTAIESQGFAAVRQSLRANIIPENILAGITSPQAWLFLKRHLADPRQISITRI